ncbi:MAG: hypothetical protein GY830_00635 [Bacteroidetes bacterium]|nr:hypothetical protein [Bacteroidota bacterium]
MIIYILTLFVIFGCKNNFKSQARMNCSLVNSFERKLIKTNLIEFYNNIAKTKGTYSLYNKHKSIYTLTDVNSVFFNKVIDSNFHGPNIEQDIIRRRCKSPY